MSTEREVLLNEVFTQQNVDQMLIKFEKIHIYGTNKNLKLQGGFLSKIASRTGSIFKNEENENLIT